MIALVMCGGKGTRMGSAGEKLLLKYKSSIIEHVISALDGSGCFSGIFCATSPNAPQTAEFVRKIGIQTVETKGNGYAEDLGEALSTLSGSVFVVSGDLALLDSEIVREIVGKCEEGKPWTSVLVSKKFSDMVGAKAEYLVRYGGQECAYTGISIVNAKGMKGMGLVPESYMLIDDKRLAINLNTKRDYDLLLGAT